MIPVSINPVRALGALGLFGIAIFGPGSIAIAQPPHADVPLNPVEFSIDLASPTIGAGGITEADILKKPGPSIVAPALGLGITPLDELDGISADAGEFLPGVPFAILFSVSRDSVGLTQPEPGLVAVNRPFNVLNQASRNQAPGDIYMTTRDFDAMGMIPLPTRTFSANNTLVINQGDTGGVDMDLESEKSPSKTEPSGIPKDNVDAVAKASSSSSGARGVGPRGPNGGPGSNGEGGPIFYTLRRGSPSLDNPPGQRSGATIFFDPQSEVPGGETVFFTPGQLGLQFNPDGPQDDISGFTMFLGDPTFSGGPGRGVPGPVILFTLAPGSPSLAAGFTPADIFASTGGGTFVVFATANQLGLNGSTDAITGFTVIHTTDIDQLVLDSAIQRILPGDFNEDGDLTAIDCFAFEGCYSGAGVSYDDNGVMTHAVDVGPGTFFTPDILAIETGDTVEWTWIDGPHNVVSGPVAFPDGAFDSGPPAGAGNVFSVVFDEPFLNAFPKVSYPYFSVPDIGVGMEGEIVVLAHPCATFDQDFDGDVDAEDWQEFREFFIEVNGSECIPLTIPEFVAVLLCQPMHPAHEAIADMNADGVSNSADLHLFIQYRLGLP